MPTTTFEHVRTARAESPSLHLWTTEIFLENLFVKANLSVSLEHIVEAVRNEGVDFSITKPGGEKMTWTLVKNVEDAPQCPKNRTGISLIIHRTSRSLGYKPKPKPTNSVAAQEVAREVVVWLRKSPPIEFHVSPMSTASHRRFYTLMKEKNPALRKVYTTTDPNFSLKALNKAVSPEVVFADVTLPSGETREFGMRPFGELVLLGQKKADVVQEKNVDEKEEKYLDEKKPRSSDEWPLLGCANMLSEKGGEYAEKTAGRSRGSSGKPTICSGIRGFFQVCPLRRGKKFDVDTEMGPEATRENTKAWLSNAPVKTYRICAMTGEGEKRLAKFMDGVRP